MISIERFFVAGFAILFLSACGENGAEDKNQKLEIIENKTKEIEVIANSLFNSPEININQKIEILQNPSNPWRSFEIKSQCSKGPHRFKEVKTKFNSQQSPLLAETLPLEEILKPTVKESKISCFFKLKLNLRNRDSVIFDFGEKDIVGTNHFYQFNITDESFSNSLGDNNLTLLSQNSTHYRIKGLPGVSGQTQLLCDDGVQSLEVDQINNFNLSELINKGRQYANKPFYCRIYALAKTGEKYFSRKFRLLYPIEKKKTLSFELTHQFDEDTGVGNLFLSISTKDPLSSKSLVHLKGLNDFQVSTNELIYLVDAPLGKQFVYSNENTANLMSVYVDGKIVEQPSDQLSFENNVKFDFRFHSDCQGVAVMKKGFAAGPIPMQIFSGIQVNFLSKILTWQSYLTNSEEPLLLDTPLEFSIQDRLQNSIYRDLFPDDDVQFSRMFGTRPEYKHPIKTNYVDRKICQ